jgi:peptide/nickel transport system permease protein
MRTYAIRRIVQTIPILFIISLLLFFMVRAAPGSSLTAARRNPNITQEQIARMEAKLGLDQPLSLQYAKWMGNMLRGDMGESIKFHRPVSELIAVPIGVLSARKPYSKFDYTMTTVTFMGQSLAVYWLGLGLILIFYVFLQNPLTGRPSNPRVGLRRSCGTQEFGRALPCVAGLFGV